MISEEKSALFEGVIVAVGMVILLAGTLSVPPLTSTMSRAELVEDRAEKTQRIVALQRSLETARQENESMQTQLTAAHSLLEEVRSEIDALTVERDLLETKVAATTSQLQDVNAQFQELKREMAQFKELVSLQELAGQRDEALQRAKRAEERIRDLTLQLNRAGIWP